MNIEISERSIQRDLQDLSRMFPLVVDDRAKPYGWSWVKDAKCFDLPGLTIDEALAWVMTEQHLSQMLPTSAIDHLHPYFKAAHQRLNDEPSPQLGRSWLNKVRTVLPNQPLLSPQIDPAIQRAVSEALLHEKRLEIHYRKKGARQTTVYQLHPLALVLRGSVLYLYARLFDYPNARSLALHRIENVQQLDEPVIPPNGFDLDDKVAKGVWGFGPEELIEVKLRFYDGKGEHLQETPLSEDQHFEENTAQVGESIVTATVADTPQLRWWIQGFADGVEVLSPESLRQVVSQAATKMAARYACQVESTK